MPSPEEINNLLSKFSLTEADFANVRSAGLLLEKQLPSFISDWYEWLAQHEEYQFFFGGNPDSLARVQRQQLQHWQMVCCRGAWAMRMNPIVWQMMMMRRRERLGGRGLLRCIWGRVRTWKLRIADVTLF